MIGTLLEKLLIAVGVDLSEFDDEVDDLSSKVDDVGKRSEKSFNRMGESWKKTGKSMMKSGAVMTAAITAPLAVFATKATQAAIDAEEMESAFDVVFGNMSTNVREWAEATGDAMGRSTQELQRGALAFQELFGKALDTEKASKLSKDFAVLTQDLASFKNLSNEVSQQKLFSGLTGEAEPLRAVGVFLNQAAVEAKAVELGLEKVNGKFTDQDLILARAAEIRAQLAKADGDVLRTSDSTANKIKASQAAYEELSITVGQSLVPALTPLIEALASMLEAFNTLDPSFQTFIIGAVAIAAILGPVVTIIGALITAGGAVVAVLGGWPLIISTIGLAMNTFILSPIGLVVLAVAALVAAFVYWEDIKKIVVSTGEVISDWYTKNVKPTVDKVMAVLRPFIDFFRDYFGAAIEGVINVVSALLEGDFSGAWEAAKEAAFKMLQALMRLMGEVGPVILNALRGIYEGAKKWLSEKLGQIWDWVIGKITVVKDAFFDLYDAVVGNSYIPDMVEGIGVEMAKLQALMVDPARRATESVDEAFRKLAENGESLLARLFPVQAQIREIMEEFKLLNDLKDSGLISEETRRAGREVLLRDLREARGPLPVSVANETARDIPTLEPIMIELEELPPILSDAQIALQDFGQNIGSSIMDALHGVIEGRDFFDTLKQSFSRVLSNIMSDALNSLEGAIFGEGGLGGAIGGLLSSLLGGSRAAGGPVMAGKAYNVGLGEKFIPSMTGRVLSRSDAMKAAGGGSDVVVVEVDKSDLFDVKVKRIADASTRSGIGQYDNVVADRVQSQAKRRA